MYLIFTETNQPILGFADRGDADKYVEISRRGSVVLPARDDLHVVEVPIWRTLTKLTEAMRKVDATWGVEAK